MKTLLEFVFIFPVWVREADPESVFVGVVGWMGWVG